MSQPHTNTPDWPMLIGCLLKAKREINERDPEQLEPLTDPRIGATEAEIEALENRISERIDESYRSFLLHANGWPQVYFELGLFGTSEFTGEGNWPIANELLTVYDSEGVLANTGVEAAGIMPIAAGKSMRHLMVIIRKGWSGAGTVVWLDAEELHRAPNFAEFFHALIEDAQEEAASLAE